jgi:NAD(P)-dependent dehydrogenase (short-subunit alcohol dehydrogenase family)
VFKGQVALVTGASRGIGRAIALELAAEAATVCLVARDSRALEEVATATGRAGAAVFPADLTSDEDVRDLASRVKRDFGRLDILVHSAGIIAHGPLSRAPVTDFDSQYRANLRAPYLLTQTVLPMLIASQGQVVFINSSVGLTTRPDVTQYSATQHALKAIADALRQEINAEGVRVLSVHPGRTATPRQAEIHAIEGKPYRPERLLQPEDVAALVLSALRLPRTAEVTDISMRPFLSPQRVS